MIIEYLICMQMGRRVATENLIVTQLHLCRKCRRHDTGNIPIHRKHTYAHTGYDAVVNLNLNAEIWHAQHASSNCHYIHAKHPR